MKFFLKSKHLLIHSVSLIPITYPQFFTQVSKTVNVNSVAFWDFPSELCNLETIFTYFPSGRL